MKKFAFALFAVCSLSFVGLTGCGTEDNTVIEAPPVLEEALTPEEEAARDASMEESMNEPGN